MVKAADLAIALFRFRILFNLWRNLLWFFCFRILFNFRRNLLWFFFYSRFEFVDAAAHVSHQARKLGAAKQQQQNSTHDQKFRLADSEDTENDHIACMCHVTFLPNSFAGGYLSFNAAFTYSILELLRLVSNVNYRVNGPIDGFERLAAQAEFASLSGKYR